MIAKPSIAFNDFSGTASEVTARNVSGRNVLSVRTKQAKTYTPSQVTSRNRLSSISRAYKQLTDSQIAAWGVLASKLKGKRVLDSDAQLTGHNVFVRLNTNLILAGSPMISDAPLHRYAAPAVRFGAFYVNEQKVSIVAVSEESEDYKLVIRMSNAQSTGVSKGWSRTVIVSSKEYTDWGELDITDLFRDVIGTDVINGQKYFVELYWLDARYGFTGPVNSISGLAGNESIGGEGVDGSRARITVPYLYDRTGRKVEIKNLDFELSKGSVISTVSGEVSFHGSYRNEYVATGLTSEQFPYDRSFVLGKAIEGGDNICLMVIEHRNIGGISQLGVTGDQIGNAWKVELFDTTAAKQF